MHECCCLDPFSIHLIVQEEPKSCSMPNRCDLYPNFFADIPDPRRTQGRRHRLPTVLAIAAGAVLCGMRGYKAISDWANSLGPKARERFRCRRENGRYVVPSEYVIRDVLIRVDPLHLDRALQRWNEAYGQQDESLAIDGKTMCNAIDEQGHQTHIMSAIGHQTKSLLHPKKVGTLPEEGDEEAKRTNEIKMAIPLLDAIDIQGKVITADALLTQRDLADYLVRKRKAHYHFTVKGNQPTLLADIEFYFQNRRNRISLITRLLIMAESKPAKSGLPPNSTTTSTFLTSGKHSSSNVTA